MLYYLHRVHQLGLKKSINRVGSFFENRWWQLHWSCRLALDPKLECPKKLFQQIKTTHVTFFLQHPLIKKELLFQNQINQIKDDFITLCDNKKAFVFNQLVSLDDPDIWQKDPISKRFINLKKNHCSQRDRC